MNRGASGNGGKFSPQVIKLSINIHQQLRYVRDCDFLEVCEALGVAFRVWVAAEAHLNRRRPTKDEIRQICEESTAAFARGNTPESAP